jgi:hypothetical protein|tara:strand:- start:815 stop:1084 length:270 start_codon:yes stop_codon:yes gene_type:complete
MEDCKTRLEEWTQRTLDAAFAEFHRYPNSCLHWDNLETAMFWYQQAFQDVRSDDRKKADAAKAACSLGEILAWTVQVGPNPVIDGIRPR